MKPTRVRELVTEWRDAADDMERWAHIDKNDGQRMVRSAIVRRYREHADMLEAALDLEAEAEQRADHAADVIRAVAGHNL